MFTKNRRLPKEQANDPHFIGNRYLAVAGGVLLDERSDQVNLKSLSMQ
jgi:hypothetical protein